MRTQFNLTLILIFFLINISTTVHANNNVLGVAIEECDQGHAHLYKAKVDKGFAFFDKTGFTFQQIGSVTNDEFLKDENKINVSNLRLNFINSNNNVVVTPGNVLSSYSNYFIGNDPAKWRSNVSQYTDLNYSNIYNGIDLKFYSVSSGIKYDFILNPGSDIKDIKLNYEGAESVKLDKSGRLVISTSSGEIIDYLPKSYQVINSAEVAVSVKYKMISKNVIGFESGSYNTNYPLIIDPLIFSTFIGGTGFDEFWGGNVLYDNQGYVYTIGRTQSNNFPTTPGAFDVTYSGISDAFILKMDPTGSTLIFSTYIGGSSGELGYELYLDPVTGDIYATGNTTSNNFPTTPGVHQPNYGGGTGDAWVLKLNSTGSNLIFSTYLGGINDDYGRGFDIDNLGNIYMITETKGNFPVTTGAFDVTFNGSTWDGTVSKLSANATSLIWSTYLGSSADDNPSRVIVDNNYDVYVTGFTNGSNFPITPGAFDVTHNGNYDVYVTKINSSGSALLYSTFLGGTGNDQNWNSLYVNSLGEVYVAGRAASGFPVTTGAYNTIYGGGPSDGFIAKLNTNGSNLVFSTFFGGSMIDEIYGLDVNQSGEIFVVGQTSSILPMTGCTFDNTYNGGGDAFIAKFNSDASSLLYSSYIGGSGIERGAAISVDQNFAYIIGETTSANFPVTPGSYDGTYNGGGDIFVLKLELSGTSSTPGFNFNDVCLGDTAIFINTTTGAINYSWTFGDGSVSSQTSPSHIYLSAGAYTVTLTVTDSCGTDSLSQVITIYPLPVVAFTSPGNIDISDPSFTLTGGTPAGGIYSGPGVVNGMFDPAAAGLGSHTIFYNYTDTNGCSNSASATVTVTQTVNVTLDPFADVCIDDTPFALSGGSPLGGMYSGPGVSNGIFNPSLAGAGTHTIVYTLNGQSASQTITVHPLPIVTLSAFASVYITDAAFTLTGGIPSGGIYSGPGVSNGMFDPAVAGIGIHTIIYSYTNSNGCSNSGTATITVDQAIVVTLDPINPLCVNASAITLTGGLPVGGIYSGTGVANGMFNPSVAGVGTHTITYTFNGQSASQTITVYPLPVVSLSISGGTIGCDNTIIIGYNNTPIVITATSSTAISYQWYHDGNLITGANSSTLNVSTGGTYSVSVTDIYGCMSDPNAPGATINFNGINASCGNNNNKVLLCHYPPGNNGNPQTLCISANAVPAHIANHPGDCIGPCPGARLSAPVIETIHYHISPNPVTDKAEMSFMTYQSGNVKIDLLDLIGRNLKSVYNEFTEGDMEYTIEIDAAGIIAGVYFLKIESPDGVVTEKFTIIK